MNRSSLFSKALIIGLSLCLVSLPTYLFLFGKKEDKVFLLRTIIQKTTTINPLSPRFFSDYLGLSPSGKALNLHKLDESKIQKKLQEFPIFKTIQAQLSEQGELLVSYELRKPIFILSDYGNLGLDAEGYILPLKPYYSPKILPQVYLGIEHFQWNHKHPISHALEVLSFFQKQHNDAFSIQTIDLSRLSHKIPAHREVIVTMVFLNKKHYLRLHPDRIEMALKRYIHLFTEAKLQSQLAKSFIFDARITKFATLKVCNPETIK